MVHMLNDELYHQKGPIWMNESKNEWMEKYLSTVCVKLRINVAIVEWDEKEGGVFINHFSPV